MCVSDVKGWIAFSFHSRCELDYICDSLLVFKMSQTISTNTHYCNIVKYYYNLKYLFSMWIYWSKLYFQHHYSSLQCHMIFRNHSNMLICCSRNISDYYQCWKQLCCTVFLCKPWNIKFFRIQGKKNYWAQIFLFEINYVLLEYLLTENLENNKKIIIIKNNNKIK